MVYSFIILKSIERHSFKIQFLQIVNILKRNLVNHKYIICCIFICYVYKNAVLNKDFWCTEVVVFKKIHNNDDNYKVVLIMPSWRSRASNFRIGIDEYLGRKGTSMGGVHIESSLSAGELSDCITLIQISIELYWQVSDTIQTVESTGIQLVQRELSHLC